MAFPPPFATAPPNLSFVASTYFNDTLKQLGKVASLANLNVMLVDLTKQPKRPVGFGSTGTFNPGATRYIASTAKVAAMFAAFRLRKNFREAAAQASANTVDDLRDEVTRAWKPLVEHSVGGSADFPNLKTIFSIGGTKGNWDIQFTDTYQKRMEGMIGPSDNHDASYCILALGYQYIQGALVSEGLYKSGDGGLWLAGDYSKGRDGQTEPISKKHQVGNVSALARFLVAVANQALVKDSASASMRRMMNNAFMFRILSEQKPSRPVSYGSFGKLGIGADGTYHDAAVIERTTPKGTLIRYAAVILGSKGAGPLWSVGKFLDDIVVSAHGG
ncbi:MAG: hypothetical protein ACT4SY_11755 [Hyphomicrobiales bacterium]